MLINFCIKVSIAGIPFDSRLRVHKWKVAPFVPPWQQVVGAAWLTALSRRDSLIPIAQIEDLAGTSAFNLIERIRLVARRADGILVALPWDWTKIPEVARRSGRGHTCCRSRSASGALSSDSVTGNGFSLHKASLSTSKDRQTATHARFGQNFWCELASRSYRCDHLHGLVFGCVDSDRRHSSPLAVVKLPDELAAFLQAASQNNASNRPYAAVRELFLMRRIVYGCKF
jgi:hypothetical protein